MDDAILTLTNGPIIGKLFIDPDPPSPKDWDQLGTLVTWHRNYEFQEDGQRAFGTPADFLERAKEEDWIFLPVGLYDHSGLRLYEGTHRLPGWAGWDSGQVGFIYASKERFEKYVDSDTTDWRERGLKLLSSEIETWDDYVSGQVYGYRVELADGTEIDSCWGYYGLDDAKAELMSAVERAANEEARAESFVATAFAL